MLCRRAPLVLVLLAAVFSASLLATAAHATEAEGEKARPCLNYWQRGTANACDDTPPPPKQPTPTVPKPVTATVVAPQAAANPSNTLDGKIDKFLENYGKPPREFVAFYLDPTPENAMKWVHTYQDILTRPQQLAYSWTQAETLYANAIKTGAPAATYTSTTYAPVQDFGIDIPGFNNPITHPKAFVPQLGPKPAAAATLSGASIGAPSPLGAAPTATPFTGLGAPSLPNGTPSTLADAAAAMPGTLNGLSMSALAAQAQAGTTPAGSLAPLPIGFGATSAQTVSQNNQSLDLTYYFAATCPYSHRMTPELSRVMSGLSTTLPNKPTMTCVDMTPYMGPPIPGQPYEGPQESNIKGQLPCVWRKPFKGEEDQVGITQTPTLLVRRGANAVPERVNGYVDADRLRAFLVNGTPISQ